MFKVVAVHKRELRMSEFKNVTKIELNTTTGAVTITYGDSDPQDTHSYNSENYRTYIVEG